MNSFEAFLLGRRRSSQSAELQCYLAACRTAEKNAERRKIAFNLTREDLLAIWQRANGKCEVTKLPFEVSAMANPHTRRPWAPSLDRIDSLGCYETGNVRVVCVAANLAMNQWGEDVLKRLAFAMFHNGAFDGSVNDLLPGKLPPGVRAYKAKDSIRYSARLKGQHVGTFDTVEAAVQGQKDHASKVAPISPQDFENGLCSPVSGGVADGTRTYAAGPLKTPDGPLTQ